MDKRLKWGLIGLAVVGVILLILWAAGVFKKRGNTGLSAFGQIQGSELSVDYSTTGEMRAPADVTVTLSAEGQSKSETIHQGSPITGHLFLHIPPVSGKDPTVKYTITLSGGVSDSYSDIAGRG
jgi:hypothetical protein